MKGSEWELSSKTSLVFDLQEFLLVLTKFSFWQGDWALGYQSMGFRYCPDISNFLNFLSCWATREATRIWHAYK